MSAKYQAYETKDPTEIVNSTRTTCYHDEHEGLVVITTTCARVKEGAEFDTNFNVSAGFNGLSLSLSTEDGEENKTFSESETTNPTTTPDTHTVKPHTSVVFYQKVYHFKTDVWFRLDSYAQMWTVGNYKHPGVALVSSEVDVHSNSFWEVGKSLSGKGDLIAATTSSVDEKTNLLAFEKCSERCQAWLHARGV